jgi:hypothetical protein
MQPNPEQVGQGHKAAKAQAFLLNHLFPETLPNSLAGVYNNKN